MKAYQISKAIINLEIKNKTIYLTFSGVSDEGNQALLNSQYEILLSELLIEIKNKNIHEIIFDFVKTSFVNSCTIKNYINIFRNIAYLVKIQIIYSTKASWQDVTFETIKVMCNGLMKEELKLISFEDSLRKWVSVEKNCPVCKWISLEQLKDKYNTIYAERCKNGCFITHFQED